MQFSPATRNTTTTWLGRIGRVAVAGVATVGLLGFLVLARWLDQGRIPEEQIRLVETIDPVSLPAPPPPPPEQPVDPPPPPPPPPLPKLEVQLERVAPPLRATLDQQVDLTMQSSPFELEVDPPPVPVVAASPAAPAPRPTTRPSPPRPAVRTSFTAGELDAKPRLVNRPAANYPTALLRQGVRQGKVVLEVSISTSGRVSVRRVIASSHPEFSKMARSFASKARFTVPKKDGRPVTAIYQWPLILRP